MDLRIPIPRWAEPFLQPARYKGAYGGRGSGKSHWFAQQLVCQHLARPGLRSICIRESQKSLKNSSKRLIEDKLDAYGLGPEQGFVAKHDRIVTPGGGSIDFMGMQEHTSRNVMSLEGCHIAWVEEAQYLSEQSLEFLRPTIREIGSELWFSWNPRKPGDAVDRFFRGEQKPSDAIAIKVNWRDNPWFPPELEQERQDCMRMYPGRYGHVWEGEYATTLEGAYYAACIEKARQEGRIGYVPADPLLPIRLFADLGGTGRQSDAFVLWAVQFVGKEIRVLNYYEAVGQPLDAHVSWMRSNGYTPDRAEIWLPHDGRNNDRIYAVSFESEFRRAGYKAESVKNQGPGAALMRIQALRGIFDALWFNAEPCAAGLEALGWYRERLDKERNIGLGPLHDWASHAADALGLMAVMYRTVGDRRPKPRDDKYRIRRHDQDWMRM